MGALSKADLIQNGLVQPDELTTILTDGRTRLVRASSNPKVFQLYIERRDPFGNAYLELESRPQEAWHLLCEMVEQAEVNLARCSDTRRHGFAGEEVSDGAL